jgi:hypothetical protein
MLLSFRLSGIPTHEPAFAKRGQPVRAWEEFGEGPKEGALQGQPLEAPKAP